jgi:predicted aspartyl protease
MESKGFFRIPLRKLSSGHYKLTAQINGKEGNFILDTGASTSCIGFESVSYFVMKSEESAIKAAGAGATNMLTEIASNNTLKIGNWKYNRMSFIIFDLSHVNEALIQVEEEAVHGIIGADFLKEVRAVIDYGRNALYVK